MGISTNYSVFDYSTTTTSTNCSPPALCGYPSQICFGASLFRSFGSVLLKSPSDLDVLGVFLLSFNVLFIWFFDLGVTCVCMTLFSDCFTPFAGFGFGSTTVMLPLSPFHHLTVCHFFLLRWVWVVLFVICFPTFWLKGFMNPGTSFITICESLSPNNRRPRYGILHIEDAKTSSKSS